MPLTHLAEELQGFAGNKLVRFRQAGSGGGNTPMFHLSEFVTCTNVHYDIKILFAFFHILTINVFWMVRNTKSGSGSI
jgi:hypothetical protein